MLVTTNINIIGDDEHYICVDDLCYLFFMTVDFIVVNDDWHDLIGVGGCLC